jgi:hypothetical protein
MTTSISVSDDDKAEFQEMKPADMTQKEFFSELLAAKRRDEGEIVNPSEIVDQAALELGKEVELAAFRGTRSALNEVLDE